MVVSGEVCEPMAGLVMRRDPGPACPAGGLSRCEITDRETGPETTNAGREPGVGMCSVRATENQAAGMPASTQAVVSARAAEKRANKSSICGAVMIMGGQKAMESCTARRIRPWACARSTR